MNLHTRNTHEIKNNSFNYRGVGLFTVQAICPDAATIEKIHGYKPEKEPEYISIKKDATTGKDLKNLRLAIYGYFTIPGKKDKDGNDMKMNYNFSFFISNNYNYNKQDNWTTKGKKCEYIDVYGNSTWATDPITNPNKAVQFDYEHCRKALVGESTFINFLKKYSAVPSAFDYKDEMFKLKAGDTSEYKFGLETEDWKKLFNGDFSELREGLSQAIVENKNQIYLLLGDTTDKDGKSFSKIFTNDFIAFTPNLGKAVQAYEKKVTAYNRTFIDRMMTPKDTYRVIPFTEVTDTAVSMNESTVAPTSATTIEEPIASVAVSDFSSFDDDPAF